MSRSQREERGGGYASARERAEKAGSGSRAGYLKLPSGVKLFKPKAGIVLLDIMPFRAGLHNPFADEGMKYYERTFFVHRNIGPNEEMVLCPRKTSGGRCPVCERKAVLARKDDDDAEALAKELEPKQRQLFNLINRKEPDAGIQIWDISYHLFGEELDKSIRASDEEDRWDAFFHLKDGFTLKVSMEDDSYSGHAFVRAGRIDFKKREPYESDMLDQAHCLDELLTELSYEKLKKLYLGVDEEEDEDEPRHRRDEDEDAPKRRHAEEEEPRSKKRHAEEEEEDETPKRKRPVEDEDEPPRKKKPADEDDEWDKFDEDKPKKKPAAEEEDEPPKRKRPVEDDEPPRKKRPVEDEDEDKPKKKPAADEDDEWDKFDEEKPKRRPAEEEEEEDKPKRKRPAAEEEDEDKPKRKR